MAWEVRPVDVDGLISVYYGAQDRRARQIAMQRDQDRQDRKDQRERDFEDAYGRFLGAGGLGGAYGPPRGNAIVAGENDRLDAGVARTRAPIGLNPMEAVYATPRNGMAAKGLAAMFANRPARPAGALTSLRSSDRGPTQAAMPERGNLMPIDPNTVDAGAPVSSMAEGRAVDRLGAPSGGPENLLPPEIQRMANSPNMDDRNAAFMEMARIDPMKAFKIQSEMRDAALDRLKGGQDALRIAASRLASTNDDNSYRAVLSELDAQLMPLGIDISKTVPPTHPGPEGIRELQMLAMKEADQLAALDREARTEAMIDNYDRDNDRQDRNTDSIIADRQERTGIARGRAATADRREARLGAGGGKPPVKARATEQTAVNPKTGERMVYRDGKWIPAKGDASGNAGGGFR